MVHPDLAVDAFGGAFGDPGTAARPGSALHAVKDTLITTVTSINQRGLSTRQPSFFVSVPK